MFLITYLSAIRAPKACGKKAKQANCTVRADFYIIDCLVGWWQAMHCHSVGGWWFFPSDF